MKGEILQNSVVALLVLAFLVLVGACERGKWRECRRYHPVWYCLDGSGK